MSANLKPCRFRLSIKIPLKGNVLASWWPLDPKEMDLVVIWGSRVVPLRLASLPGTSSKGKYFV